MNREIEFYKKIKCQYTFIFVALLQLFTHSQNVDPGISNNSFEQEEPSENPDLIRVNYWNKLANYHKFLHPDSGIYYSSKALELSRSISFREGELWALVWLALSHQTLENYTIAVQVNLEGLRKAEQWDLKRLEAIFLMDLAICYLRSGNFERALTFSQKAFTQFKSRREVQFSAISASTI